MPDKTSVFPVPPSYICPPFSSCRDIAGLRVTVMGLGLHGGGAASARFFAECGADVTVTDKKSEQELRPSVEALADLPRLHFVLGTHREEDFRNADLVIKNPGVKFAGNPYLAIAPSVETDISVFLRLSPAKIVAVTGSKGKSSTVSAIHFGLQKAGIRSFLGGNITVSPLTFLRETGADSVAVLELSSWQLADLRGRGILHPVCAVITPVMPDHQNWYKTMEDYVADKKVIYSGMTADGTLICNFDDEWGKQFAAETSAGVIWYSAAPFPQQAGIRRGAWLEPGGGFFTDNGAVCRILPAETAVPGSHMKTNLLAAGAALTVLGIAPEKTACALGAFPGIPHRLEFLCESGGIKWYNDSAATIPEAAAGAVRAFREPVVLICGGTDKNLDFAPLAGAAKKAKAVILFAGSGTEKLRALLAQENVPYAGPYTGISQAVEAAGQAADAGDAVVFSPGAASFEYFQNEFDRGSRFKNAVHAYCRTAGK